jgi:hypothetical protein
LAKQGMVVGDQDFAHPATASLRLLLVLGPDHNRVTGHEARPLAVPIL